MKKIIFTLLVLSFSTINAQNKKGLEKSSLSLYNTDINVKDYKVIKAETLLDLALNYSYTRAISLYSKNENTYLNLPILLIGDQLISEEQARNLKIGSIKSIKYIDGPENTIYGQNGLSNAVIKIELI